VTGFGKGHGVVHGFTVTNLAHQDHIRRLAQRIFQGGAPAVGVESDFALRHHAVLVHVDKLHRVFDRDDVAKRLLIAPVHHGGQRGGLARSGGPHKYGEPALGHGHFLEHLRHAQPVNGGQHGRNDPHHHANLALLQERVDAKPSHARRRDREIAFLGALKLGRLLVVHDGARQCQRVPGVKRLRRHLGDAAVHLHRGRKVAGDEQVAAVAADHQAQEVVNEFTGLVAFHDFSFACSALFAAKPGTDQPEAK